MSCFKPISLRLRLTLLSALVMSVVAVILTISSIDRAGVTMVPDNYDIMVGVPVATTAVEDISEAAYFIEGQEIQPAVNVERTAVPMSKVNIYTENGSVEQTPAASVDVIIADEVAASAIYRIEAVTLTKAAQQDFAASSAWILLAVIAGGVLLTWFVSGRALRPVSVLADAVEMIDAHHLSTRVPSGGANDEISRLTEGVNGMLDKLEEAFIRQRTFSANAAHELKTPLAAIRSNIEILDMDDTPDLEEYQETLEVVRRNTDRLINLVGDLLALNDQNPCELLEPVECGLLMGEVLEKVMPLIEEKGLMVAVDNQRPVLYGQKSLLLSAVGNLVENAVKYTPAGGQIQITVTGTEDEAVVAVWNDSPAIAPEQQMQIFEPFYRVDESRSQRTPGCGLGLSLVQAIAQKFGGRVEVTSTPEEGTTFTLSLPQGQSGLAGGSQ